VIELFYEYWLVSSGYETLRYGSPHNLSNFTVIDPFLNLQEQRYKNIFNYTNIYCIFASMNEELKKVIWDNFDFQHIKEIENVKVIPITDLGELMIGKEQLLFHGSNNNPVIGLIQYFLVKFYNFKKSDIFHMFLRVLNEKVIYE